MFQSWYDRTRPSRRPEVQKPRLDHPRNLVDNLKLFFLGIFSDEHAIKIHDSLIKWLMIIVPGHFRSCTGVTTFWYTSDWGRCLPFESIFSENLYKSYNMIHSRNDRNWFKVFSANFKNGSNGKMLTSPRENEFDPLLTTAKTLWSTWKRSRNYFNPIYRTIQNNFFGHYESGSNWWTHAGQRLCVMSKIFLAPISGSKCWYPQSSF